jgi:hypothetical protein
LVVLDDEELLDEVEPDVEVELVPDVDDEESLVELEPAESPDFELVADESELVEPAAALVLLPDSARLSVR